MNKTTTTRTRNQTSDLPTTAVIRHVQAYNNTSRRITNAVKIYVFLILIHVTILPVLAIKDYSTAFSYAKDSVVQYHNDKPCVYPDPQLDAPVPTSCSRDISIILEAHVSGTHSGAAISAYHAITSKYVGSPPSYNVSNGQDTVVCLTGPLRLGFETRCWDPNKCPDGDITCSCGSRHDKGDRVVADGCAQPDSPAVWTVIVATTRELSCEFIRKLMLALGLI